ncbi:unnamed protein product [Ilex paraguariensis]|uniref:Pectinesterase inhibitor domain-containing protein n=1 Tax=Ilex paraguariensis TaxID=185542 RepID=A0ABC8U766_9AQUA
MVPTLLAKTLPTTLSVRRLFIPTHVPPTADRYVLAYIAFDLAYVNATHTNDYIGSLLKNVATTNHSKRPELARQLQRCHGFYGQAVQVPAEALNDLDSETYFNLGLLAVAADHSARDCEVTFNAHSSLSRMNQNLRNLSKICLVVSKLLTIS